MVHLIPVDSNKQQHDVALKCGDKCREHVQKGSLQLPTVGG